MAAFLGWLPLQGERTNTRAIDVWNLAACWTRNEALLMWMSSVCRSTNFPLAHLGQSLPPVVPLCHSCRLTVQIVLSILERGVGDLSFDSVYRAMYANGSRRRRRGRRRRKNGIPRLKSPFGSGVNWLTLGQSLSLSLLSLPRVGARKKLRQVSVNYLFLLEGQVC